MSTEAFGGAAALYLPLVCIMAYLVSGHLGIYGVQVNGQIKHLR
ncbi:hypothetical protein [Solirubrum puertoriconensis]|nr:hypothetical protein [Solirubrum puertoriconensis]